jgi:LysM repeat protein
MRLSLLLAVVCLSFAATAVENTAAAKGSERARPSRYVVRKGEPLYQVAEKFGCSIDELKEVNSISKRGVKAGTSLKIPGCGVATSRKLRTSEKRIERDQQRSEQRRERSTSKKRNQRGRIDAVELKNGRSQSVGVPWRGKLYTASKLSEGSGYVIRRPARSFGTHKTVGFVRAILADFHDNFPTAHVVAVGDISAKRGGRISEHRSHQSGRDIDIGLLYKHLPDNYPDSFVDGNANNLDLESTWGLLKSFALTASKDGGAQAIYLDYEVAGLLYQWAKDNGEDEDQLGRWFQYPHGRDADGLIRHQANHADHMHVRFKCSNRDRRCGS